MKPGDVVELKEGTFGLKGDGTLAIYLDRTSRKKQRMVVVHTVKGRRELKAQHIRRVVLKARVDDPLSLSDGELTARLKELTGEARDRKEQAADAPPADELTDRTLWEAVVDALEGPAEANVIVKAAFGDEAQGETVGQVRSVLADCQRPGVGYFERAEGRGERFRALTRDEVAEVRREIEGMRGLRNRLIEVVEEDDPETGEPMKRLVGVPVADAELTDDDQQRLERLAEHMVDTVLHDRPTGTVGLGSTSVHTLDGFTLARHARFLAFDWLGATATSVPGAYVRFLMGTGQLTVRAALELVAERMVRLAEHIQLGHDEATVGDAERLERELAADEVQRRRDLRELATYTIDPPDAKDFDDAISLEADGDGHRLYVHIADVSHYVAQDSRLDREARLRGTSCYLPTGVLPMLPARLADDLCSLRANEDRPAMTAILTVSPEGDVVDAELVESVIHVDENLAYGDVDEGIVDGTAPFAELNALAERMASRRRGLALETDELRVTIEHDSVDPHLKGGSPATKLIEQFMVAANEAVASALTEAEVPAPYRCHPLPDRSGVDTFNARMRTMELSLAIELPEDEDDADEEDDGDEGGLLEALQSGKVELVGGGFVSEKQPADDDHDDDDASEATAGAAILHLKGLAHLSEEQQDAWLAPFQHALATINAMDDRQLAELVQLKLLACLGRALYTPANLGHFGLGSTCYLHFTSPIRRYPDLATHRQLKWLVRGADGDAPYTDEVLAELCSLNTDQAVEAERLERDLIGVALAFDANTERRAGRQEGLVMGITKGGVFLSLGHGLEARLATADIPGGPWSVDEADSMLFKGSLDDPALVTEAAAEHQLSELYNEELDEVVRVRMRLGDRVPVEIVDVDLVEGHVRVRLAE